MNEAKNHPQEYFAASAIAASLTYPLWRATAVMQSGFVVCPLCLSGPLAGRVLPASLSCYVDAALPPYKGLLWTVAVMTWGRAAIFWGSDVGRDYLRRRHFSAPVCMALPPIAISTLVQVINMPIVRASVTLQNPLCPYRDVPEVLMNIYRQHGLAELWRGTSTGIIKALPMFSVAVVTKNVMEDLLPAANPGSPTYQQDLLWRSAYKSCAAALAGAAMTNPLDVIRNQMFRNNESLTKSIRHLHGEMGWRFAFRGLGHNIVAMSVPIAVTIFLTDTFVQATPASEKDTTYQLGRVRH